MITDLHTLREALIGKRSFRTYLEQLIEDYRNGALLRRARACDSRRKRFLQLAAKAANKRDEYLASHSTVQNERHLIDRQLTKLGREIEGLQLLCGLVRRSMSEQEKEQYLKTKSQQQAARALDSQGNKIRLAMRSGKELDGATWRWIAKFYEAAKSGDESAMEQICEDFANHT